MNPEVDLYRTVIVGTLVQESGLSVGGAANAEGTDTCHRDGRGLLTIPGTSLAGHLIETAGRIFPALLPKHPYAVDRVPCGPWQQITAKTQRLPPRQGDQKRLMVQSVWRFEHAHPATHSDQPPTEWRQGVGIRQATGASAGEKGALYDCEFVPAGTQWPFFLEIDTHRGGADAEAVAVLALAEWVRGFGWLGRSAARGTGWFRLAHSEDAPLAVLRLPKCPEAIELWPDNTRDREELVAELAQRGYAVAWPDAVRQAVERAAVDGRWQRGDWHYLSFRVRLSLDVAEDGYGLDVLEVGGHPAIGLVAHQNDPLPPLSVAPQFAGEVGKAESGDLKHWRVVKGVFKTADSPFVTTHVAGQSDSEGELRIEPYLPGSGLRGPLRHSASRLQRAKKDAQREETAIRDPNWQEDLVGKRLSRRLQQKRAERNDGVLYDEDVHPLCDSVAQLFGVEELGGRILVRDAMLVGGQFQLARVDHHAEDEFTAGVYGPGKFDRNVLLSGAMEFRIVVEGPDQGELWKSIQPLLPVLDLAAWGHVPIGGGKWRGAGWLKWQIDEIELRRVGDENGIGSQAAASGTRPSQQIASLWEANTT